jgi:hypothetical protein
MDLYYGLIVLGLAGLSAPFFAKLAGYEITHRKPFDLVGVSGILFLLTASFQLAPSISIAVAGICTFLKGITFVLGWLGLLCGALWAASEVLRGTDHGMLGAKL